MTILIDEFGRASYFDSYAEISVACWLGQGRLKTVELRQLATQHWKHNNMFPKECLRFGILT